MSLKQATIDAKAAELGFKKVGGSFSNEAQQAATLALIMEQTADAHGNFARESDTLQGKQQRLAAEWGNLSAQIGTAFLPAMTELTGFIGTSVLPVLGEWGTTLANQAGPALQHWEINKAFRCPVQRYWRASSCIVEINCTQIKVLRVSDL